MSAPLTAAALVHRSKFLSLVLRHDPARVGLVLDEAGWADVDAVLAACAAHGAAMTRDELDQVVRTNDKQRFALSDDGRRIRASQGHSIEVELGYEVAVPPERLYHGTVAAAVDAIRAGGLRPMARHAVHLSPDSATAARVGGRRGRPVVLVIRAGEMHRAGHELRVSANGVWLAEHVPPEFLELPADGPEATDGPRLPRVSGGGDRKAIARDTIAACDAGRYARADGAVVELAALIERATESTHVLDAAALAKVAVPTGAATSVEVTDESTVAALIRLGSAPGLTVLNFASAKNPGGGFLGGAQAQEESLARASALYPCLVTCNDSHYARNRAHGSVLYLDLAIVSWEVPFFRDDGGGWLDAPVLANVITCAAPNASALRQQRSPEIERVPEVLRRRAGLVLRAACAAGARTLVLGAWGAGVFGNDPELVADAFAVPLAGPFATAFDRVVFAVLDGKPGQPVRAAFRAAFG